MKKKLVPSINGISATDVDEVLDYMRKGHDISNLLAQDPIIVNKLLDEDLLEAEIMSRDYKEFFKGAWHILEPANPLLNNWHIDAVCNIASAVISGDIRNVIISLPPRHLIADSTPVITTKGWKTHGTLEVGDRVYHPSGISTQVSEVKPPNIADYEVAFSNGEIIKCNKEHLWTVYDRAVQSYSTIETSTITNKLAQINSLTHNNSEGFRFFVPDIKSLCLPSGLKADYCDFNNRVWIVSATRSTKPEQGRCITVEAEDGLYLVGRRLIPTHNSKSRIISDLLVPWAWIADPWMRFLYAAHNEGLAVRASRHAGRIIKSKWYQDRWGSKYACAPKDRTIENNYGGYRIVKSVQGSVTGEGGHVIIGDDLLDARNTWSDVRQKTNEWYSNVFANRIEGGNLEKGRRIIICQRLHDMDIVGHVLENLSEYNWEHFCLPAEFVPKRKSQIYLKGKLFVEDIRKKKGEILHEARLGRKGLAAEKLGRGSFYYASQFQQDPIPEGGGIIKADWLVKNIYTEAPEYWYENCNKLLMSWDMTFQKSATSDYVVGQLWGRSHADLYLIAQIRQKMDFPTTKRKVIEFKALWPKCNEILIENKANGPAIIASLKATIQGIVPFDPQAGKHERLASIAPIVESGNVHLPDPTNYPWVVDNIIEASRFPAAPYDDTVDAMSQAVTKMQIIPMLPEYAPTGVKNENSVTNKQWSDPASANPYTSDRPWHKRWSA